MLVSSFVKATNSRMTLMAINWRGRLQGLDTDDAGNYEAVVMYDQDGAETPSRIRESLSNGPPFRRQSDRPVPGTCESLSCRYSMITNWAFQCFDGDLRILPDVSTPTRFHLPIVNLDMMPWPFAVIVRSRRDTLSVLYILTDTSVEDLKAAGAPLSAT